MNLLQESRIKMSELQSHTTTCGKPNPYQEFKDWYENRKEELLRLYKGTRNIEENEVRAYQQELIDAESWRSAIRLRAKQNNWRRSCQ